jgi:hypothetical protein
VAKAGVLAIDKKFVFWHQEDEDLKQFIEWFGHLGTTKQQQLFEDLSNLSRTEFWRKYFEDD